MRRAGRIALGTAMVLATLAAACKSSRPAMAPAPDFELTDRARPSFEYTTIDGKSLTTDDLAGRISVIGFAATYDVASQAEARFLANVARHFTPRVNVVLIVLEPPENLPLIQAFAKTLDLRYPVALADPATIAGTGTFSGLHHVPSVIVLDPRGRERWRHIGLVTDKDLERVLTAVATPGQRPGAAD